MAVLEHKGYKRSEQNMIGTKFLISNGYLGYRGTLDEADSSDFVALNLNGIYDGNIERESLNVYNPLYIMVKADGINLNPKSFRPKKHLVSLDTSTGVYRRHSEFKYGNIEVSVKSERFVDQTNRNLIYSRFMFKSNKEIEVEIYSGIDTFIWNLNDIHLVNDEIEKQDDMILIHSKTKRTEKDVFVGVLEERNFEVTDMAKTKSISKFKMVLRPDKVYTVYKYAGVMHSDPEAKDKLKAQLIRAKETGFKDLYQKNEEFFEHMYEIAAVNVYNNDTARDITEYAVYQLIAHRPANDYVSVPLMGLSGQYGYGAVEWSAEMMIMPFYINTDTESARHMVMYRVHGLEEAKKRARNCGYDGALYPVLSGANGVELDPKEIENMAHINGSIIYGVYQYIERTADYSVLFEGALEMLLEMCRFYLSFAKLSDNQKHYDFLRVRGIDNSHGKIDNEVYTNKVIDNALDAVIKCVAFAKQTDKAEVKTMFDAKNYEDLIKELRELRRRLYTKKENIEYLVEAFDGYFSLPDKEVSSLKRIRFRETDRYVDYRESSYVQNSSVLITLAMFREDFPDVVHRTCYDHYMRRSVNPDYLARTMYVIEACESGVFDDALDAYNSLGDLDIKNPILFKNGLNLGLLGGLYQAMVYGFAGVRHHVYLVSSDYHIPPNIRRITCKLRVVDNIAYVKVKRNSASVKWSETDDEDDD